MMKCILLLICFGVYTSRAQDIAGKLQLSVASGYQQGNLRWSIAGNANGQNPNVLSELRWENVGGPGAAANMRCILFRHWQLEGEYNHVFFSSGKVYDTDYGGNDRTDPRYAEQFDAGKGSADYWQAGLANRIPVTTHFSITPSAGYGIFHQSLYITGSTSAFSDLNSTYKTKWAGPYGQVMSSIELSKKLSMDDGLRYSQVQYRANANWNLIRTFSHPESFRHKANGYGINVHASMLYHVSDIHSIGIKGIYSNWQTGRGIDELYPTSGGSEQTQLNEVRSTNWQVIIEWRISFSGKLY